MKINRFIWFGFSKDTLTDLDTPDDVRKGGRYLAYLLRLWRKNNISNYALASLESRYITIRIGFSGREALFEYIR